MSDMTQVPERRRSSFNPQAIPEWNQTTSSLGHLRDSLLKDDEGGATGLQVEVEKRRRRQGVYNNVIPHKPKPSPKPRKRGTSSMDRQVKKLTTDSDTNAATSQSDYVPPCQPDTPESSSDSEYVQMSPIRKTAAPSNQFEEKQMDSDTADTFLNKVIDGHLICNICNKRYDQPKMLKCSHSFCSHCLSEKIQHLTPTGTLPCPICMKDTPISGDGVNDLQDNTLLQALIDDVSKHVSSLVGQRSDDQIFLQESQTSSNENKILRVKKRSVVTYEVMSLKKEQPLEPFLTDHSAGNLTKCLKHPKCKVTHFCITCKQLICSDCIKVEHIKHQCVDAALAEEQGKKIFKLLLDMIKKQKVEYVKSVSSLEDAYCRLHSMIHNTKKKISDQKRYQIMKIKEKSAALREEATQLGNEHADKIEEQHKKHCEGAKMASNNQDILEYALNKASQLEFLSAKDNVFKQCNKMLLEDIPKPMHKLSFLDFAEKQEDSQITMGHLLQTERWELHEQLFENGDEPFQLTGYIAMYSNEDIAVTDMLNWQLKVIRHDNKSCTRIDLSEKALVNPFAVAINKDDELLVIDQNKVKVFDNTLKFLFEVPNSYPQNQKDEITAPSLISCLAVDKQNRIAVGNRGKQAVCLHQQDGKLLQKLRADFIETHMTMTNRERIIYSNYHERKLVSMDYKGKVVFCVSTADKSPTGVCCDTVGFIYVAMHSMFMGKCEIHQYNPTGEFIGCMVEGLYNPLGMIFTPGDQLAVADKDSVKFYCRV